MKRLTITLLTLLISGSLWAGICDGPSADKPEYKEYCKRQDKSKVDLDAACKDDINSSRCDEALDLVFGKESRREKKTAEGKEIDPLTLCLNLIEEAKKDFLKTCSGPPTIGSTGGQFISSRNYCMNQANQIYNPMRCLDNGSNKSSTTYTLWLIGNNNVQKYASFKDFGSCMNRCQSLQQRCTCQAD